MLKAQIRCVSNLSREHILQPILGVHLIEEHMIASLNSVIDRCSYYVYGVKEIYGIECMLACQ